MKKHELYKIFKTLSCEGFDKNAIYIYPLMWNPMDLNYIVDLKKIQPITSAYFVKNNKIIYSNHPAYKTPQPGFYARVTKQYYRKFILLGKGI